MSAVIEEQDEETQVYCWRLRALQRAGYDNVAALRIAEDLRINLHFAVDLVEHGCPPELAARILI